MIFDIKDVKSWATRNEVKVGDEGYFADSIDTFRNSGKKYIELTRGKIGGVLDDYSTCFQIENSRGSFGIYAFFIPLDKVKEEKKKRSSDANSVPRYRFNGGEIERLTKEESKELGGFLHDIISDYLDLTLLNVTDEVKQQAIRKANTYKRIYNKLIKPIYKVEE